MAAWFQFWLLFSPGYTCFLVPRVHARTHTHTLYLERRHSVHFRIFSHDCACWKPTPMEECNLIVFFESSSCLDSLFSLYMSAHTLESRQPLEGLSGFVFGGSTRSLKLLCVLRHLMPSPPFVLKMKLANSLLVAILAPYELVWIPHK